MDTTTRTPDEAAALADFGRPSARKTGRNPKWPYVPVIKYDVKPWQEQIKGLAFVTRSEAVARAESVIARRRANLATKLAEPRYRALRAYHGVTS